MYKCRTCNQPNSKKVVLLHKHTHTHTRRRLHHSSVAYVIDDVLLKAMPATPWCRSVHVVIFFWDRPAAKFLYKFCSSLVSYLEVEITDLMKGMWVSAIWKVYNALETLTRRLCALIELTHWSLKDKELTTDLAHDMQMLLSHKHVMVIRVKQYKLRKVKKN